ncbi:glycosyltransferase [Opitutaceae bacterium EW11]|nr:glycosyltransferase [Opitutaceae bacterium EW11]
MKILVLQDYLRSGGTERQSVLMSRAFQSAGHEVLLLTFRPGGALAPTLGALPHASLQLFDTGLDWFAPGLHRAVRRFAPDVVLCMGRMANCRAGGIQSALLKGTGLTPVVATMRTGKPLPLLFRRSLETVQHVVANSEDAKRTLVNQYGLAPRRVSVIRNALVFLPRVEDGPGSVAERDQSLRSHYDVGPGACVLLWVGMFRPEKNQSELIELAAHLPEDANWRLWFAGDGPERPACEDLVNQLGLRERVRFFGFVQDPSPLYAAADIAVLTSKSESLSNFLIEAHVHGVPSVSYRAAGVVECGGHVVPAGDQQAFVDALAPLMRDARVRHTEGERVAAFARKHFSPTGQATAYLNLFRTLIQRNAYEE